MDQKRCCGCMNMRSAQGYVCEHCGYDERMGNLPTQLAPGTLLQNQYLVGKVLGQGGFGITYMGWDLSLNSPVAIKEYYPTGFVSRVYPGAAQLTVATSAADGWIYNSMEKFIQEARTLAQFSDENEIVHVRNVFRANGTAYIIMEFVRGITLKHYVESKGGKLSVRETLSILSPVMGALDRVHKAGVIHRDISPDNIMILPNGKAKLLDFGAARVVGDTTTGAPGHSTQPVVKHGFAPIEQYQSRGYVGSWTDVYAMCCTIYYCLAGDIPADAPERVITNQEMEWKAAAPDLTDWQVQVLNWGT
jgi:serine/threonine protein kinase